MGIKFKMAAIIRALRVLFSNYIKIPNVIFSELLIFDTYNKSPQPTISYMS